VPFPAFPASGEAGPGVWYTCEGYGDEGEKMDLPIEINKEKTAAFCRKHHITKLALFGSVLTDCFGPDSDVDVLVEFDPGHIPGLIALSGMERELSEILGRKADMRTPNDLSRYFRDEVVRKAVIQYAA
jgi:predicted nucleotidyltransferase